MFVSKNGKIALTTDDKGIPAILEHTNKHTPTGGVVRPIIKFKTAKVAKCNGSIPTAVASDNKGTNKIINAAIVSMNIPTNSNNMLISNITIYLFSVIERTPTAIAWGMRSETNIQPKTFAKPTKINIPEAEIALSTSIFGTARSGNSL